MSVTAIPRIESDVTRAAAPRASRARVASGLRATVIASVVQGLGQVATLAILARLLSPAEFGVYGGGLAVVTFLSAIANLGLTASIVQAPSVDRTDLRAATALALLAGGATTVLLMAGAAPLASLLRIPESRQLLLVLAPVAALLSIPSIAEGLLLREGKTEIIAKIEVMSFLAGSALTIAGAMRGYGVWSLAAGQLFRSVLRAASLMTSAQATHLPGWNNASVSRFIRFGGQLSVARIFDAIAVTADNLVVGRVLGAASLGVYTRVYSLVAAPTILLNASVDRVLFPELSRRQREGSSLSFIVSRQFCAVLVATIPATVLAVCMAPQVVDVLLGHGWNSATIVLRVLALGLPARVLYKVLESVPRAQGDGRFIAGTFALYACAVVVGSVLGARSGMSAVAFAVVIATSITAGRMIARANMAAPLAQLTMRLAPLVIGASVATAVGCQIASYAGARVNAPSFLTLGAAGALWVGVMLACKAPLARLIAQFDLQAGHRDE